MSTPTSRPAWFSNAKFIIAFLVLIICVGIILLTVGGVLPAISPLFVFALIGALALAVLL